MKVQRQDWICCQLGAREHYAIPRALYHTNALLHLITDAWVKPNILLNALPIAGLSRVRERYHYELAQASVDTFTFSLVNFELYYKWLGKRSWALTIARNNWFQHKTLRALQQLSFRESVQPILFAYSYTALEIFRYAKDKGWRTVLGQINPGPLEEEIVSAEYQRHPNYQSHWQAAPLNYWDQWREECELADEIIVNSEWSADALQKVDIPSKKIAIIPLAYKPPTEASTFTRLYPSAFDEKRPLRILFLGQVNLRKGIAALLEAAEILQDQPVEFWLVGPTDFAQTKSLLEVKKVKLIGGVSRYSTAEFYKNADVFLFPTLSDGFGITQLEAQAWQLPLIVSKFCGAVVQDKVNGLVLPEVSGEAIAHAIHFCLNSPQQLQIFAQQRISLAQFDLFKLGRRFQSLFIDY